MRPISLDTLSAEQLQELDELYRRTHDVRVRTRAQMILRIHPARAAGAGHRGWAGVTASDRR